MLVMRMSLNQFVTCSFSYRLVVVVSLFLTRDATLFVLVGAVGMFLVVLCALPSPFAALRIVVQCSIRALHTYASFMRWLGIFSGSASDINRRLDERCGGRG